MTRISIIIPSYNRAHLLPAALDSALAQTIIRQCEIIVVDDGTEPPLALPDMLPAGIEVRMIRRENGGLAAARNTGIAHARGEFIALLDDDDAWHPEKLDRQLEALTRSPECVLCTTRTENIAPDGSRALRRIADLPLNQPVDCLSALLDWNFIPPSSVLIRKSTLEHVGGFRAELRQAEDYELWARLANCGPFLCLADPLTYYATATPGSLSNDSVRQLQYELRARRAMRPLLGGRAECIAAWRRGRLRCLASLRDAAFRAQQYRPAVAAGMKAVISDPLGRQRWEWRRLGDALGLLAASGLPGRRRHSRP